MKPWFAPSPWFRRLALSALVVSSLAGGCGGDGDDGGKGEKGGSSGTSSGGSDGGVGAEGGSGAEAGVGADAGAAGTSGRGGSAGRGGTGGTSGEGGSGGEAEPARFSILVEPASVSVPRGASAWLTVRVERERGFDEPVSVTFDALPEGFVADTLVLPATVDSGILPLATSDELAVGARVALDAVGASGAQRARAAVTLRLTASAPSAQEKIRAALVASSLDYETSLLYRAYAVFGDARLPAEYVGSGSDEEDNGVFDEIFRRMSALSPAGRAALTPFVVRPAAADSAWSTPPAQAPSFETLEAPPEPPLPPTSCPEQSGGGGTWISRRSTAEAVRVWAQCQGTPAGDAETLRLVDNTLGILHKIYAPMVALMTAPIGDEDGGDAAIDLYLVDAGGSVMRRGDSFSTSPQAFGTTFNAPPAVEHGASAFVVLPRTLAYTNRFHATVIHEFFHVLQNAHNYEFSHRPSSVASNVYVAHWFPEASATWASAHFDRVLAPWEGGRAAYADAHYRFALRFQKSTFSLNAFEPVPYTYAAYIWPYFVEQETESAAFMSQIWEGLVNVTTFEAADDAIDAAFPFGEHFDDFAVRNLNTAFTPGDPLPASERYVALDSMFPDGVGREYLTGTLAADEEYTQALEIPNLAARYVLLGADPLSKKVEFDFSGLEPAGSIGVRALVHTRDGWLSEPLDFSDDRVVKFCFDLGQATLEKRGSFDSILLVITNRALRAGQNVSGDLVVNPSTEPCTPVWSGTITMSYRRPVELGVITSSSSTPVTFEYDESAPQAPFTTSYRLRSGTYIYDWLGDYTNRTPTCRTREQASGTMIPGGYLMGTPNGEHSTLTISSFFEPATYRGEGGLLGLGTLTSNCNDNNNETTIDYNPAVTWWVTGDAEPVSEDGMTLEGEHELSDGLDGTYTYRWHLTRSDQ
jgi:hypothetical protein